MTANAGGGCAYFYEDEICRVQESGKIQFGIVLENAEYASSEDEVEEDVKLKRGQIRVAWYPTGKEQTLSERNVQLADRSLMPGDVVAKDNKGNETQCGYVRKINVVAAIKIVGLDAVIADVKSEDLQPLEAFSPDIAVTHNNWVGMIRSVKYDVLLRTKDGSLCSLNDQQVIHLKDYNNKFSKDSEFQQDCFYPGQLLAGKMAQFDCASWIEGSLEKVLATSSLKSKSKVEIISQVESVTIKSLGIQWQCQSAWAGNNDSQSEQPKFIIEGEDLKRVKMLNVFEPCTLQLGDKSFYKLKDTDKIMNKEEWNRIQMAVFPRKLSENIVVKNDLPIDKHPASTRFNLQHNNNIGISPAELPLRNDKTSRNNSCLLTSATERCSQTSLTFSVPIRGLKRRKLKKAKTKLKNDNASCELSPTPGEVFVVETLFTSSSCCVVWQDGSIDQNVSSRELFPVHHLDDKEFFPGDFVIKAENSGDKALLEYGVVQRVLKDRTAMVRWMKTWTASEGTRPEEQEFLTETSVYDLKDHPDFKFRPGSIVVRVSDSSNNINEIESSGTAGQVIDNHTNGKVEVWWADGFTTFCWPQELYRVGDYDSEAGELWEEETEFVEDNIAVSEDDSQYSWETTSQYSLTEDKSDVESFERKNNKECSCIATKPSPSQLHELQTSFEKARLALDKVATFLEKKREAIAALSELDNPGCHMIEIMNLLLDVYHQCRNLDQIMESSFFHEKHFEGLLEKIQESQMDGMPLTESPSSAEEEVAKDVIQEHNGEIEGENQISGLVALSTEGMPDSSTNKTEIKVTVERKYSVLQDCARISQLLRSQLECSSQAVGKMFRNASSISSTGISVGDLSLDPIHEDIVGAFAIPIGMDVSTGQKFKMLEHAPIYHKFYANDCIPIDPKAFQKRVFHELALLQSSALPYGIRVKTFEDRMDLFSVVIDGPPFTPYQGGLFIFDFQLPNNYPLNPPICHYWSYNTDRINPNLYEEGKVCVSLLGTWSGKGTEMWGSHSNLLQVLMSIQALILNSEPYYNEAGYEKLRGSQQSEENSRLYNEMVLLKILEAMGNLVQNPPDLWREEILEFLWLETPLMIKRFRHWISESESTAQLNETHDETHEQSISLPSFPLLPVSRGFRLSMAKSIAHFEHIFDHIIVSK